MRQFSFGLLLSLSLALAVSGCHHQESKPSGAPATRAEVREGDILFQSLPHDPLVDTIEGSTHSAFSHCGIVHQTARGWVVIEAVGPVKETPLDRWRAQGREGHFAIYRFEKKYQDRIPAVIKAAQAYEGRPYDIHYQLDDEKIYCSELIFKAFHQATGEELGKLQRLGDLDWRPYQKTIEAIEGGAVPIDRMMITPRALSEAHQLKLVASGEQ